jgi:hypothetical protein
VRPLRQTLRCKPVVAEKGQINRPKRIGKIDLLALIGVT